MYRLRQCQILSLHVVYGGRVREAEKLFTGTSTVSARYASLPEVDYTVKDVESFTYKNVSLSIQPNIIIKCSTKHKTTRLWANAQRDGRPAKYRCASVQRRKVWLTPTAGVPCSNAVKTRKPLKFIGVPQTPEPISAVSGPKFAILWGHLEDILLFNKFFSSCRCMP